MRGLFIAEDRFHYDARKFYDWWWTILTMMMMGMMCGCILTLPLTSLILRILLHHIRSYDVHSHFASLWWLINNQTDVDLMAWNLISLVEIKFYSLKKALYDAHMSHVGRSLKFAKAKDFYSLRKFYFGGQ